MFIAYRNHIIKRNNLMYRGKKYIANGPTDPDKWKDISKEECKFPYKYKLKQYEKKMLMTMQSILGSFSYKSKFSLHT